MSVTHEQTEFTITRHGDKTKVVRLKVSGEGDMVGKTYVVKEGSPIYAIDSNVLTERTVGRADKDSEFYVKDVLGVENEYLHPSTWSQDGNIFLVNGDKYIHFGSAMNTKNIIDITKHDVKKGAVKLSQWVVGLLLAAFIVYIFEEHFLRKHFGSNS